MKKAIAGVPRLGDYAISSSDSGKFDIPEPVVQPFKAFVKSRLYIAPTLLIESRLEVHYLFLSASQIGIALCRRLHRLGRKVKERQLLQVSSRNLEKLAQNTMSAKRTPVPLPGSKPKGKSKVAPPKSSLSQELVGSDDDSSTESAPKAKKAEKPKATIGVHRPNGAAKPSTKDNSTPKSKPIPKSAPKKPAPKTIATSEQVEELSSSEVSDDNDAPARDIQTKLPGEVEMKDASSESDSDSESDSSSEEEAAKPAPKTTQPAQSKPHEVELRAAKPYTPPKGYILVSEKDRTSSQTAKIFDNLQGRQVWHITAPAGVSLKELESISMDKAMKGASILSQKGTDYGFSMTEKSEDGPREILLPQKNGYSAGTFVMYNVVFSF